MQDRKSLLDNAEKLVHLFNNRRGEEISLIEIANELNTIYQNFLPLLIFGRDKIFFSTSSKKWKMIKKVKERTIAEYITSLKETIDENPGALSDIYQRSVSNRRAKLQLEATKKRRRARSGAMSNTLLQRDIDYTQEEKRSLEHVRMDGFHYGRKKTYEGPFGKYWEQKDGKSDRK